MARNINKELKSLGWDDERAAFDDILADVFSAICPSWTDEELLLHPRDAIRFCNAVRVRTSCKGLSDDLILRTLTGNRKQGKSCGAA